MISLLFHEITHLLLSLLAVAMTWSLLLRKGQAYTYHFLLIIIFGAILGGFLVDVDHLFDYFLTFGTTFHLDDFLTGRAFLISKKIFVPLHAWELVIVLSLLIMNVKRKMLKYFLIALTLGLVSHLVYDAYSNDISLLGYSFFYRVIHNFDARYFSTMQ